MITLIGSSTNLVVSDLLTENGAMPLSMFELTPIGLPVALLGIGSLLVLGPRLPERRPARADLSDGYRELVVRMIVLRGGCPWTAKRSNTLIFDTFRACSSSSLIARET